MCYVAIVIIDFTLVGTEKVSFYLKLLEKVIKICYRICKIFNFQPQKLANFRHDTKEIATKRSTERLV